MATALAFVYSHVTKTPDVCGGQPCIDGTRVRVKNIAALHQEGMTPEQMLTQYPFLNLAQLHAALAYYYDNRDEIDTELAEDERTSAEFDDRRTGYLTRQAAR